MTVLKKVSGRARGAKINVEFRPGVNVLAGPTGSLKTTTINLINFALTGTVRRESGVVKQKASVFEHLGGRPDVAPVEASTLFEIDGKEVSFARRYKAKTKPNGTATVSGGLTTEDGSAVVGDIGRLDINAMLNMSGPDRRKALVAMCESVGTATIEWAVKEYLANNGTDPKITPHDDGVIAAVERAHHAAREEQRRQRNASRHAHEHANACLQKTRGGNPTGKSSHNWGVEITRLDAAIEEAIATLSTADVQWSKDLSRELDRLVSVPTKAAAEDAQVAVITAKLDAADALEALRCEHGKGAECDACDAQLAADKAGLESMRSEYEEALKRSQQAAVEARVLQAELERVGETAKHVTSGDSCPLCSQHITEEIRKTLLEDLLKAKTAAAEAVEDAEDAAIGLGMLEASGRSAQTQMRERIAARDNRLKRIAAQARVLEQATKDAEAAEAAVADAVRAEARREEIREQLSDVGTTSVEEQQSHLEALRRERRQANTSKDAAMAHEIADTQLADARATAATAVKLAEVAGKNVAAWQAVMNVAGQEVLKPFVEAVATILPDGWGMRVDLDTALFLVTRPDMPEVPLSALSHGEAAMAMAACSVGVARCTAGQWRVAIVDHAEALSNWPGPDGGDGLFVAFVDRLQRACDANLIDQAIVAYSRLPEGEEAIRLGEYIVPAPGSAA